MSRIVNGLSARITLGGAEGLKASLLLGRKLPVHAPTRHKVALGKRYGYAGKQYRHKFSKTKRLGQVSVLVLDLVKDHKPLHAGGK